MRSILWKRLDRDGHDACHVRRLDAQWRIEGCAVFLHTADASAHLTYKLVCDDSWCSLRASVEGWVGWNKVHLHIERGDGDIWLVNGSPRESLAGLQDIDLGFTPATNTNALRRLCLGEGARAMTTAVWLDTEDWDVKRLPQSYHRIAKNAYDYTSPMHDFRATLSVDDFGIVTEYPGLWSMQLHATK